MSLEKAFLQTEKGERIPCLFNPESISVSRSNSWTGHKMPGQGVPQLSFTGSANATMSLNLTFDTTDTGRDVTSYTSKIMKLMDIDTSLSGTDAQSNNARPPTVTFHWGSLHAWPAVITSASMSFTYFGQDGTPLRATMQITLQQYKEATAFAPQNPTSGTPRPHRVHRVQPGETLDRISAHYYGDSTRWRQLAAANQIEDPLALRAGSLLTVPRMDAE